MLSAVVVAAEGSSWRMAGQNLWNTRHQAAETRLSPHTVGQLRARWVAQLNCSIYATPAVDEGAVYVPDSAGFLYRINAQDGTIVWSFPLSFYTGIPGDVARVTPVVTDNALILGTQSGSPQAVLAAPRTGLPDYGARLIAVDKRTGQPLRQTLVDPHPAARINQAAVVSGDYVYVGITSWEEVIASLLKGYVCCSFRGSVLAVNRHSGAVRWKHHMAPEGYSGNAVWGSTPVVDTARCRLYVTTGNNYMLPREVLDCVVAAEKQGASGATDVSTCYAPDNYFDAIVALDLETGRVQWAHRTMPFDAHTHACIAPGVNPQNCPSLRGPDYDFAQGPMLFTVTDGAQPRQLLGAGQKSGVFRVVDPDDGRLIWKTTVGPGGITGGMQWGSATDGKRIYVAIANFAKERWTLQGHGPFAGQVASGGFWSALDAATGTVLWQTPEPNAAMAQGMLTVANGVVFAGSMAGGDNNYNMFALDASTGQIVWHFLSVGSVNAGAAVVDGTVYWGSGYEQWDGTPGNKLYAFDVR